MRNFIKQKLRESLNISSLGFAKQIELSPEEIEQIKNVQWNELSLEPQREEAPVPIHIGFPFETNASEGISVDIDLTPNGLYQIHISLADNLQGLGLGYKIYKALILTFGHLYSGEGRRMNTQEIPKIWDKLNSEPDITCYSNELGKMCVANIAKNKEEIIQKFTG